MAACGAVVAIWNGIAPAMQAEFLDWHVHEHIPERVAIPGFLRGRRFIAADDATHPAYFTLYEAAGMEVLTGADYATRLNAPTEWTRRVTAHFRDTSRSLARVIASTGTGAGGAVLSLRFAAHATASDALAALVRDAGAAPRVNGAHLCVADLAASGASSAESAGRADLLAPPAWFALIEATDPDALAGLLADAALWQAGAHGPVARGRYRLEYLHSGAP